MSRSVRDPFVSILSVLLVLLVPSLFGLFHLYSQARDQYFDSNLPSVPSESQLLTFIRRFDARLSAAELQPIYQPGLVPRSGLVGVYQVLQHDQKISDLAVLRHDIACATCNDLLVAVFLDSDSQHITNIVPIAPWELQGEPLDPTAFLSQLKGQNISTLRAGPTIDGITGATYSVQALFQQLHGLGIWLNKQSPQREG